MGKRNIKYQIRKIKLEEAAQAVALVLEEQGCDRVGFLMSKKELVKKVPDAIDRLRYTELGNTIVKKIPTVYNYEVGIANEKFVANNWSEIRKIAATYGYYIIWNPKGEGHGIRLASLREYERCQATLLAICSGVADTHNEQADIIREYEKPASNITVNIEWPKRKNGGNNGS